MQQLKTRELSNGDTLVTWAPDAVLFHTAAYANDTVRAGLLRGDRMTGTAEATATASFEASIYWAFDSAELAAIGIPAVRP